MKPIAIVGALVGGLIGAVLWGAIVAATAFEIGYMATGVGFLVGFGSALLGGRGQLNGVICSVIALLAMFGGKIATVRFIAPRELRKIAMQDPENAKLPPGEVDRIVDATVAQLTISQMADMASQSLDPIDILFAVIGIAAAYRIGGTGSYKRPVPSPSYGGPAGMPNPSGMPGPARAPLPPGPISPPATSFFSPQPIEPGAPTPQVVPSPPPTGPIDI